MLQTDEEGPYLPGYRVAPDCGENYSSELDGVILEPVCLSIYT